MAGNKTTKISAIKAQTGLDSGDIYLKTPLSLNGSAEQIFQRMSKTIFSVMIPWIIDNNPTPKKQHGQVTIFKRRTPEQSKLTNVGSIQNCYNFIRMLDASTYPKAFLETAKLKFDFSDAKLKNNRLTAKIHIYEKK